MKPSIVVVALIGVVANSVAADAKPRNISQYERAGPYILDERIRTTEDANLIEASIRDFLWRHWHERRLGFLTVVIVSIEGLPNRTAYFVEPDKTGVWQILSETKSTLLSTKPESAEHYEKLETSVAYSVERAEPLPDGTTSDKAIPAREIRDALSYRLVLKDQQGKVVAEL